MNPEIIKRIGIVSGLIRCSIEYLGTFKIVWVMLPLLGIVVYAVGQYQGKKVKGLSWCLQ
jgi:hypothetical protein